MALKNPLFQQNATTGQDADEARLMVAGLTTGRSGVAAPTHLAVSPRGAGANMSVDVAAGSAFILGTENALQGTYHVYNDAVVNLTVPAADATNARKDLVIINVRDSFYSGAANDAQLQYITGTPSGSPVEPNLVSLGYKNYMVLALVDVPAADTAINTGQITDRRTNASALGGTIVCTSTTRPASPYEGMFIYETDTDRTYRYTGSAWQLPHNIPWGWLGKTEQTTLTSGVGTGGTDFCSLTVTVGTSRRIQLVGHANLSGTGTGVYMTAKVDGVTQTPRLAQLNSLPGSGAIFHGEITVTPSAGSRTFVLGLITGSGTVNIEGAVDRAYLEAFDVGGV